MASTAANDTKTGNDGRAEFGLAISRGLSGCERSTCVLTFDIICTFFSKIITLLFQRSSIDLQPFLGANATLLIIYPTQNEALCTSFDYLGPWRFRKCLYIDLPPTDASSPIIKIVSSRLHG